MTKQRVQICDLNVYVNLCIIPAESCLLGTPAKQNFLKTRWTTQLGQTTSGCQYIIPPALRCHAACSIRNWISFFPTKLKLSCVSHNDTRALCDKQSQYNDSRKGKSFPQPWHRKKVNFSEPFAADLLLLGPIRQSWWAQPTYGGAMFCVELLAVLMSQFSSCVHWQRRLNKWPNWSNILERTPLKMFL